MSDINTITQFQLFESDGSSKNLCSTKEPTTTTTTPILNDLSPTKKIKKKNKTNQIRDKNKRTRTNDKSQLVRVTTEKSNSAFCSLVRNTVGSKKWVAPQYAWLYSLTEAAVANLKFFAQVKKRETLREFIPYESIPQILYSKANALYCQFFFLFLGASWSNKDFVIDAERKSYGLQHFKWAKDIMREFEVAMDAGNNIDMYCIARTWLKNCGDYFSTSKPCWKWFCRLINLLDYLEKCKTINTTDTEMTFTFNWMFCDLILCPTEDLGKIKSVQVKRELYEMSRPVLEKYISSIKAEKSIVIFVSAATTSDVWDTLRKIPVKHIDKNYYYSFKPEGWEEKNTFDSTLYFYNIIIEGRESFSDKLLVTKSWNQYGHPLLSKKTYQEVAENIVKILKN